MGEVQAWTPALNGAVTTESRDTPVPTPHPGDVSVDNWRLAEAATRDVIESIQPTVASERRRRDVIEYVQNIVRRFLGSEVFPFGSVPLLTYLPDGDIDLTALCLPQCEDTLSNDVRSVLESEEQNQHAEFQVKDVQYIHAEVKLVKCLIQNIVVDISFNQIGGLCTLCFLEQIDRLIGKDHIFKRSIVLIKAWCYYESRILGAHHGLISTYALETLVLYIFHLFHSSLDGPLAVLYRFLDYYSKFDWDNYCISLYGPVSLSSLPELVSEAPENEGGDLLLSKDYLKNCAEVFSVPPKGPENNNSRIFSQKHLNIVDPLKDNNNLGRSVSRANFYRIRSAFTYGARKLGRILLLPPNRIENEVKMFFTNTLDRHGSGERPDVYDALPNYPRIVPNNLNGVELATMDPLAADLDGKLSEEINAMKLSDTKENGSRDVTSRSAGCSYSMERSKNSLPASGKYSYAPENGHQNVHPGQSAAADLPIDPPESSARSVALSRGAHHSDFLLEGVKEASETLERDQLSDLSGDADLHMRSLQYAQCSQEYLLGAHYVPPPRNHSNYHYQNKHSWDPAWRRSAYTTVNASGVSGGPPFPPGNYQMNPPYIPGSYGVGDVRRPRGTGTYFPNTSYRGNYRERHSPRGKFPAFANLSRQRINGRSETSQETNIQEKVSIEAPIQLQIPVINASNHEKMDIVHSVRPALKETNTNGFTFPPEGRLEFGTYTGAVIAPPTEPVRKSDFVSPQVPGTGSVMSTSAVLKTSAAMGSNHERPTKGYQLKDEGDFPPLSG